MTSQPMPPSSAPGRKSLYVRLWLNTWRGRAMWFFAGVVLAFAVVWTLVRMTPGTYRPLDPTDNMVIDLSARAQNLIRYELHTKVERVPLGEQTWTITQDEVNSYLAVLPQLADERVSDPFVAFGPGTVTVSARIRDLPGATKQGGVATLVFAVTVEEHFGRKMGQVKLVGARAGRLPVPVSWVEARIRGAMPQIVQAVEKMIQVQLNTKDVSAVEDALQRAGAGQPFPLEYRINKKDVVVKEIKLEEGRFTVVLGPAPRSSTIPGAP
jgi:hypothetical protein